MASWMVHFRVAEGILSHICSINQESFIVGNIGPDCGEPSEDWRQFTPPSEVTHWKEGEEKNSINYEKFYRSYLLGEQKPEKYAFYLGYFVHLITDVLWSNEIYLPTKMKYRIEFEQDKDFIWTVKKDWYDLDHLYLKENPEFQIFRLFEKIGKFPNIYLPYYSEYAIEKQIKYISNFYQNIHEGLYRDYPYLTKERMDRFVSYSIDVIWEKLRALGI